MRIFDQSSYKIIYTCEINMYDSHPASTTRWLLAKKHVRTQTHTHTTVHRARGTYYYYYYGSSIICNSRHRRHFIVVQLLFKSHREKIYYPSSWFLLKHIQPGWVYILESSPFPFLNYLFENFIKILDLKF